MTQRIAYFTAGSVPTEAELADIAQLKAASEPAIELLIRNAAVDSGSGVDADGLNILEDVDAVSGAAPGEYILRGFESVAPDEAGTAPALTDTQVVISDGDTAVMSNSQTATFTVVGGVVTDVVFTGNPGL